MTQTTATRPERVGSSPARTGQWWWLWTPDARLVWFAFAAVHLLAFIGFAPQVLRGEAPGELAVYREWAEHAFRGDDLYGLRADWLYPLLAWIPIAVANLFGPAAYAVVWLGALTLLNAFATAVLLGHAGGRRPSGAWFWVAGLAVMGPVGMTRLEGVVAPLAVAGLMWIRRMPFIAGFITTVAAWISVWPVAIIPATLAAGEGKRRFLPSAILVTAAVTVVASLTRSLEHLFGFVRLQEGRTLHAESPLAVWPLWSEALGLPGTFTFFNRRYAAEQVGGPLPEALAQAAPWVLLVLAAAMLTGMVWLRRRGADSIQLLLTVTLAIVSIMLLLNLMAEAQYTLWLLPIVAVGVATRRSWWWRAGTLVLAFGALSVVLEMWLLPNFGAVHPLPLSLLTARAALLVLLICLALVRLMVLGGPHPATRAPRETTETTTP